jgi:hypothetical protein
MISRHVEPLEHSIMSKTVLMNLRLVLNKLPNDRRQHFWGDRLLPPLPIAAGQLRIVHQVGW